MNNAKPNFRLLTDMDDVLENLLDCWMELLRFFQRNNPEYMHKTASEITQWNIADSFPMLTVEEVFQPLNTPLVWDMIRPLPDAVRVMKKYNDMDGVDVRILTSSHYSAISAKREFLRRYFPFINWNQIIVTSEKQFVTGNVLIDDYEGNLLDANYHGLLFDCAHNRAFDETKYPNITRVFNWKDAETHLDRMIHDYFSEGVAKK